MRRPARARLRAALQTADIPTFSGPRAMAQSAGEIRFLRAPGWLPAGQRLYVVGDVHGCGKALASVHRLIAEDLLARPIRFPRLVYLGDYFNQGADSAGTLALLTAGPPVPGLPVIALMGDHERMLIDALNGERAAATDFLWSGGRETLASWGVDPDLPREQWEAALPSSVLTWLRGLVLTYRQGSYLFVHAGIRPGTSLQDQSREDLLTIRHPFLSTEQDFGVVVVHGHSTATSVHIGPNRIGLDTGAGIGGKLTCAVLEDDVIGLLAADAA